MYTDNAAAPVNDSSEIVGEGNAPRKPPRFDEYRIAATPSARKLVEDVIQYCLNVEKQRKLRKLARCAADLKIFRGIVEALVSDLAYQMLMGHETLRITRSKTKLARASRYDSDLLSKQLPYILDLLKDQMGFIKMELGYRTPFGSVQTEIAPAPWLVSRIQSHGLSIYDFDRREGEELVLLKGLKVSNAHADLAQYEDDVFTLRARAEVQSINRYLRSADITYDLDMSSTGQIVDERNCWLRRIFTRNSFESGGRLFGGFWQSLGMDDRLENIQINSEPIVSLDYKSMLAHLAYAQVKVTPPAADAYVTTFLNPQGKEVTINRGTVKKLFAASLFAERKLGQWPDRMLAVSGGLAVSTVLAGIWQAHPALEALSGRGIGHQLQYSESVILIDVLLRLIKQDIPALPLHDCVLVQASAQADALGAMLHAFKLHTGATAYVDIKSAGQD